MKPKRKRSQNTKKRLWILGKAVLGIIILLIALFPIYWLVLISLRTTEDMTGTASLFLKHITWSHYLELFTKKDFGVALKNSIINAGIALALSLALGLSTAYILSRRRFEFRLKRKLSGWVLLVRILPPVAFVVPLYILFTKTGMIGSRLPIIMACMLINIPLIIWFILSFFQALPESVEESGMIDGATEWQLFMKVVLPLVLPGIAAVAMLSFMYAWNEYTYSVILTRSPSQYTIPLALAVLNTEDNITNFGLVSAGGVCSFIPVTLFVVFAQNYLINGLSNGAVKE